MAKTVHIKEISELGLDEPNPMHIQESYLRQITHSKPLTARKKSKSDVRATGTKWFRQKGTGRARQGERTNPHLYGGGLAFPPLPRTPKKRLNKQVRQSAVRSAVLSHINNESAFVIQGKDFDNIAKTKEVAEVLNKLPFDGDICLVLPSRESAVWRASRNIWNVRLVTPEFVNVRDLVESGNLVFTQSALDAYREFLKVHFEMDEGGEPESKEGEE